MAPREPENNDYAKFGGDKKVLWYVMVFSGWTMVQLETHVPFSQGRNVMYEELSSWSRKSWARL